MRTPKEYQEALDWLSLSSDCEDDEIAIKIIQELIDESTPKKVLNKRKSGAYVNVYVGECPKCGKFVTTIDKKPYQCECRQEFDWSDE